jgi:hypothetical protein
MRTAKFSGAHPTGRADSERIDTANAIDIGAILTSELVSFDSAHPARRTRGAYSISSSLASKAITAGYRSMSDVPPKAHRT